MSSSVYVGGHAQVAHAVVKADQFADAAETAKKGCPVSQALAGTTITLTATLA